MYSAKLSPLFHLLKFSETYIKGDRIVSSHPWSILWIIRYSSTIRAGIFWWGTEFIQPVFIILFCYLHFFTPYLLTPYLKGVIPLSGLNRYIPDRKKGLFLFMIVFPFFTVSIIPITWIALCENKMRSKRACNSITIRISDLTICINFYYGFSHNCHTPKELLTECDTQIASAFTFTDSRVDQIKRSLSFDLYPHICFISWYQSWSGNRIGDFPHPCWNIDIHFSHSPFFGIVNNWPVII